jgi:error-prone DNA polymerase
VEESRSTGLSLRRHPASFLREEVHARGIMAYANLATVRDGCWVVVPGIVLVRQKPCSAKCVATTRVRYLASSAEILCRTGRR